MPDARGLPRKAGTLIVGGGLAGSSLAAALAHAGDPPVVLEARGAGWGASGRNAGFVLAQGPDVATGADPALHAAARATRACLSDLATRHAFGYRQTGSLRLAVDEGEATRFEEAAPPEGVRVVRASDLPAPWNTGRWPAGWLDAGDGVVDPVALVDALIAEAEGRGATLIEGIRVEAIEPRGDRVVVRCATGDVDADRVVVATNAWTRQLLPEVAIEPRRAQMLEARLDEPLDWKQPVYARGGADYWRAMPDGRVLLGGCRDAGGAREACLDERPSKPVQAALDRLLHSLVGDRVVRVTRRWAGIMGFTPDGVPFLGPSDLSERVWLFAGFHGHGVGWAPGLAQVMATALGRGPDRIPAAFRMRGVDPRR